MTAIRRSFSLMEEDEIIKKRLIAGSLKCRPSSPSRPRPSSGGGGGGVRKRRRLTLQTISQVSKYAIADWCSKLRYCRG